MSTEPTNPPLQLRSPPDVADPDWAPMLSEPFARAWEQTLPNDARSQALRERLLQRLAASREAEAGLFTARLRRLPGQPLAEGVSAQTLYLAQPGQTLRPGEPLRARVISLAPGARFEPDAPGAGASLVARHREWLVLSGSAHLGEQPLSQRDYHVAPMGCIMPAWTSVAGARLFLRESDLPALPGDAPRTVRDADAGWPPFAPGIQRRVLWQRDGQAAMLYCAQPGAQVPQHSHGHDEECLMVQGELFLDDLLLQPGDYQLAPAGTGHRITETDTGVVIYAHGDLDLRFVA